MTRCRYARRGERCVKGKNYLERQGLCPLCVELANEEIKKIPAEEFDRYFADGDDGPEVKKTEVVSKKRKAEGEKSDDGKTKEDAIVVD